MPSNEQQAGAPQPIAIDGELTIYTVGQWKGQLLALLAAAAGELELDLSAVSEIDTAGQQLLIALQRHAEAAGRPLRLGACSAAVADLRGLCRRGGSL